MCKGPWTDELSLVELILAKKFSGALVLEVQRGVRAVSATTVLFPPIRYVERSKLNPPFSMDGGHRSSSRDEGGLIPL